MSPNKRHDKTKDLSPVLRLKRLILKNLSKIRRISLIGGILPLIVISTHVFISPYTKVEESFTLHAIHDLLSYGLVPNRNTVIDNWDHVQFPGAVPRSFLPAIIIAYITYPFKWILVRVGAIKSKIGVQILVRLVLGLLSSTTFSHLQRSIRSRFGNQTRIWFCVLSLTQFHIPYYASRTIPNFVALPIIYLFISLLIRYTTNSIHPDVRRKKLRTAIAALTAATTIIRLEIALFLLPCVLALVILQQITLGDAILSGMIGGFGSLLVASPIDYYLWLPALHHPDFPFKHKWQIAFPEFASLHYNVFQSASDNWGIMPRPYYYFNSLPKICLATLPLTILGIGWLIISEISMRLRRKPQLQSTKVHRNGTTSEDVKGRNKKEREWWMMDVKVGNGLKVVLSLFVLGVVALLEGMSQLGHKEWRFIVYCVPVINVIASLTATSLWSFNAPRVRLLFRIGLLGLILGNIGFTIISTYLSMNNYPGGEVWRALEDLSGPSNRNTTLLISSVSVHLSSYPLQTGASLFTFIHQETSSSSSYSTYKLQIPITYPIWTYSKSETLLTGPVSSREDALRDIDYLVLENGEEVKYLPESRVSESKAESGKESREWKVVKRIKGLNGLRRSGKFGLKVDMVDKLVILGKT